MGKRRIYDEDVHEVFGLFGVEVAIFFEAVRYKQQLHKGYFFPFPSKEITKKCDLSYKQQLRVRKVLETTGWLETQRGGENTCCVHYRVTELAESLIRKTPRRRDTTIIRRALHEKLVNRFA